ncbi:hypothetical protein KVH27_19305 [Streptomyces olivaceus]|uniref:hypothetical protein n=1 Tax=Streptomyces olivaceus TaxID=47716 RepID=UPI001CCA85EA|nr:hypothetical protein [Streptomyces olivaceus]MBZ6250515.1 hypothetical protein [Streptomyces olivaceus]
MNHSSKPGQSFSLGSNHLHGVLRNDQIRNDTLTQLVQHWREPADRDAIIAALDELADVAHGARTEGELDAAIEQVEDVAGMDSAQVEVQIPDVRRLLAELTEVERVLGRFGKGASLIKHPSHAATRRHLAVNPLPEQQDRRTA